MGARPGLRLTQEQMRAAGERLSGPLKGDRHAATRMAEVLGVSARWMRTQRGRAERGERPRRPGRPSLAPEERARVRGLVETQRALQGTEAGWRPILEALRRAGERVSRLLVEQELSALKRAERAAEAHEHEEARQGLEVLARDAVWGEDTTHLGRGPDGGKVEAEVLRDLGTKETVGVAVGGVPTAGDAVALLERAADERGGWPLVRMADQGSINRGARVVARLREERVVHLLSRVHTPTDNAATERGHGELKAEARLGCGAQLVDVQEARERVERARLTLDEGRLRATLGWRTAAQVGRELPRADALVDRAAFYEAACSAMERATLGLTERRAVLHARREALFDTLERFGLARRHVGRRPRVRPGPSACCAARAAVECPGAHP